MCEFSTLNRSFYPSTSCTVPLVGVHSCRSFVNLSFFFSVPESKRNPLSEHISQGNYFVDHSSTRGQDHALADRNKVFDRLSSERTIANILSLWALQRHELGMYFPDRGTDICRRDRPTRASAPVTPVGFREHSSYCCLWPRFLAGWKIS